MLEVSMNADLDSYVKSVAALPLVKHYMQELHLYDHFKRYIPKGNHEIEPAEGLCVLIANIVMGSDPLYKVEEWLADYADGKGEAIDAASKYNDDRLARYLDCLFKADRHSLMSDISSEAIQVHELETERVHNDSTSITFSGAYDVENIEGVLLCRGYNKDHRPDCKQIVFGLNTIEDGHVPLSFQLFDGNRSDDSTHICNWNALRELLGKEDFIYIADSKLCSIENMGHIERNGGKFITILIKNRSEYRQFCDAIKRQPEAINWELAYRVEDSRKRGRFIDYKTHEGAATKEGYRLIWVHSSSKASQDQNRRERLLKEAQDQLEALEAKLNRYYLKTEAQITKAVHQACAKVKDFIDVKVVEEKELLKRQKGVGRAGPKTEWEEYERVSYRLEYSLNQAQIQQAACMDGIFPLVTNTDLEAKEVLRTYKEQPYLEKRHSLLKSVTNVAPVYLKKPHRIEAIMFLYFVALMIISLMERNIRKSMQQQSIEKLPILPQNMNTKAPTWENIKYFFRNVHLIFINQGEKFLKSILKGLTKLHHQLLHLLKVPLAAFENLTGYWWAFDSG